MMPKKRAPGGGRNPEGEFARKTATFTTRITRETRAALERGAQKRRVSLSQHVEFLLQAAMYKPTAAQLRHQALGRAIEILAGNIERKTGQNWRDDAFTARALVHATDGLLLHFAPVAAPASESPAIPKLVNSMAGKMPDEFAAQWRTPAGLGHISALAMIAEIEDFASKRPHDEWSIPRFAREALNVPDYIGLLAQELAAKRGKP